jgi:hypothetical protein
MNSALLLEDIDRIKFLMGHDSTKIFSEQIGYSIKGTIVSEQNPPAPARPAAARPAAARPTQTNQAQTKKPAQNLTPQQVQAAKQKIQQVSTKAANSIFQELMKAFDMDGDRVLTDYDGTNEKSAIAAIQKIKNRETLDALNRRIAMTKQYKDLKSWLNAEMSDFDAEYGQIWSKLEKMGYAGANRNVLLQYAGKTGVGQIVKAADKAIDQLRGMSFEDIMEGFRGIVGGTGGTIAQILIGAIPGIGQGTVALLNGLLFGWDMFQKSTGSAKFSWFNAISDFLSTVLSFIPGGKASTGELAAAKPALEGATTLPTFFAKLSQSFPSLAKMFKSIAGKLSTWGGAAISNIRKGVAWLVSKVPFLKSLGGMIEKALSGVSGFLKNLASAAAGTTKQVATKVASTFAASVPALYKSTTYLTQFGKNAVQSLGRGLFAKIEGRVGRKIAEELDKAAVDKIEEFLWSKGENLAVEDARPIICKWGTVYCATFDIISNSILVTKSAKDALKKTGKATKQRKQISKFNTLAGKVKKSTQYAKAATKAAKQGYKTGETGLKGYEQVKSDIAQVNTTPKNQNTQTQAGQPKQRTMAENSLNEEIQEIKRYISLI